MRQEHPLMSMLLMVAVLALLSAGAGFAQTPDGQTPAEETVCDPLSGAAFGLCNAYCEAMDCELLDDGDPETSPSASPKACYRVKNNFIKVTGEVPPCDCPPDNGQLGCPCEADLDCLDELSCDDGICMPGGCPPGDLGCPCIDDPDEPFCNGELVCDNGTCVVDGGG